jgi:hypothetical protein
MLQNPATIAEAHQSITALEETPLCHPIRHLVGT